MEEQFCTYEIALALKELGFNEKCFGYYKTKLCDNDTPTLNILECNYNSGKYITLPEEFHTDAPLWQQALDWFREKHKIDIDILTDRTSTPKYTYEMSIYMGGMDYQVITSGDLYKTYEEARTEVILRAIEL